MISRKIHRIIQQDRNSRLGGLCWSYRVKGFASRGFVGLSWRGVLCVRVAVGERLRFYIGFSTNLRARLRQHQDGESFATSHRGPWKLIYYEAYTEREDAEGREKFLKSGAGRRFLRAQLRHYLKRFPARDRGSASTTWANAFTWFNLDVIHRSTMQTMAHRQTIFSRCSPSSLTASAVLARSC